MQFTADPSFVEENPDDVRGLVVSFHQEAMQRALRPGEEDPGHPIFEDVDFIRIRVPGDITTEVYTRVDETHLRRFGARYRAWKQSQKNPINGQPLAEWPAISRSQVESLGFHGIRSVEELAALTDERAKSLGMGFMALAAKARDHLARAKDAGHTSALRTELEAERMRGQAMAAQLEEMKAALADLKRQASKGKG